MDDADVREVIRLLQGLLTATHKGELEVSTPNARSLFRKLEGALIALELTVAPATDTEQQGIAHETMGEGIKAVEGAMKAATTPPPGPPPPRPSGPDANLPWVWMNGQWVQIVTDTGDGVSKDLVFPKPQKKRPRMPPKKTGKQPRGVTTAKGLLLNGRRYDPLNPAAPLAGRRTRGGSPSL